MTTKKTVKSPPAGRRVERLVGRCVHCPIIEQTADGNTCGRCWFLLWDNVCERHGDVSDEVERFEKEGHCTIENVMRRRKGLPQLGAGLR